MLLGRVLCRDCQQDMDDALVCGTYEQKRSWSSRDCCVCKSYSSCFVSASELGDTESDKDGRATKTGAIQTRLNRVMSLASAPVGGIRD